MYPKNLVSPVDISIFPDLEGVVDMIYNPGKTRLMLDCEERKVNHISGLSMLVAQAKQASEYFTNKKIDNSVIDEITDKINFKLSNITLIGMPGSGKSTVGKAISEITGRDFIDTDDEIVKKINMPIPEFFSKYGEEKLRDIESEITEKFSKKSGLVISTGGGVVKRQKNIFAIRQNSFVVYLDRDVDSLPKDGRPLSMKNDLRKMKEERLPLYLKAADFTYQVENLNPKINARNILNLIKKRKN
jgi:shikimate dehydrogenase